MPTFADIISIGDEILYGQTLDTNSHWISGRLDEIGIKVRRKITIGDSREEILSALQESQERTDVVLITGGLGPTSDDLTKPLLAEFFGVDFSLNEEALAEITSLFAKAGREMTEPNRQQALLPSNCLKITNRLGTAPGMWFNEKETIFVSMPGVPYEMTGMMDDIILPKLKEMFLGGVIHHKIIKTIGVPESVLAAKISDWEAQLPASIRLAYLPSFGQVKLRLTAVGSNKENLEKQVQERVDQVLPLISKYVYGFDQDEIEQVIGRMLEEKKQTIGLAESCTGGYLSHLITTIPGSSAYFKGAVVSYDNAVKNNVLKVSEALLDKHGAVSEEVVIKMAQNIREVLGTDVGLSISGVAGPGGGTEEKPVGTVWICYSDKNKTITKKYNFSKDRNLNIKFSAYSALNMFRIYFSSN